MDGMDGMQGMNHHGGGGGAEMKMYMHGSIGTDALWFNSWVPKGPGATVGVCIGLFLLAILDRYLHAFRAACNEAWRRGRIGWVLPTSTQDVPAPEYSRIEGISDATAQPSAGGDAPRTNNEKVSLGPSASYVAPSADDTRPAPPHVRHDAHTVADTIAHLPATVRRNMDPGRVGRWSHPFQWSVDIPRGLLHALQTFIHYMLMLAVMMFQLWWIISIVVGAGVGEALFGRFGHYR